MVPISCTPTGWAKRFGPRWRRTTARGTGAMLTRTNSVNAPPSDAASLCASTKVPEARLGHASIGASSAGAVNGSDRTAESGAVSVGAALTP